MVKPKDKSHTSTAMLNSLDEIKVKEFGHKQMTLKDITHLGVSNNNDAILKTPNSKLPKNESLSSTPKAAKRLGSISDDQEIKLTPIPALKKHKIDTPTDTIVSNAQSKTNGFHSDDNETKNGIESDVSNISNGEAGTPESQIPISTVTKVPGTKGGKFKGETDEEIQARRAQQMRYLNTFVDISMKYSQSLQKKIATSEPGGSSVVKKTQSPTKDRLDIIQHLKYFVGELRDYQVEGVTWLTVLFENSVNGILADEMGLGKTIQIIALFCHLYERKVVGPFLILAPLSTLENWVSEFAKYAPKLPVVRLQGSAPERKQQMERIEKSFFIDGQRVKPVVVCAYHTPLVEDNFFRRFTWQYIVVDEGHRIKNPETRLAQELRVLNSVNRTLLTGTPLQNDINELWALFNFLMPELFKDMEGFSSLIELEDMRDKGKLLENEARNKIISTIHKVLAPFMLRREKKFVLTDIVPKKEMIIYCSLTEMQNYLYRATLQKDLNKLLMRNPQADKENLIVTGKRKCRKIKVSYEEGDLVDWNNVDYFQTIERYPKVDRNPSDVFNKEYVPIKCPEALYKIYLTLGNNMMQLRKIVNHPYLVWCPLKPKASDQLLVSEDLIKQSGKLLVLDALLPKLKANGHKILIFSTSVMFMDMIEEMLMLREYNYRRLDGNTEYKARVEDIDDFMNDPEIFIFLLSTRAGGLGLNLTAADTVIFMDRDWNPMIDLQAQGRCHRIGQTKPVMVYSLVTKGTVDEIILCRGDMKRRLEKIVLQEGKFKTMKKQFDDDDLKELEDLLNNEEKLIKIQSNGLIYSDSELDQIADRSGLFQEMANKAKK